MPSLASRVRSWIWKKPPEEGRTTRGAARAMAKSTGDSQKHAQEQSQPPPLTKSKSMSRRITSKLVKTLSVALRRDRDFSRRPHKSILKQTIFDQIDYEASQEAAPATLTPVEAPKKPWESDMFDLAVAGSKVHNGSSSDPPARPPPLRSDGPGAAVRDAIKAEHGALPVGPAPGWTRIVTSADPASADRGRSEPSSQPSSEPPRSFLDEEGAHIAYGGSASASTPAPAPPQSAPARLSNGRGEGLPPKRHDSPALAWESAADDALRGMALRGMGMPAATRSEANSRTRDVASLREAAEATAVAAAVAAGIAARGSDAAAGRHGQYVPQSPRPGSVGWQDEQPRQQPLPHTRDAHAPSPGSERPRSQSEALEGTPRTGGGGSGGWRDETCPISTGGGTRRVQLVREGGGWGRVRDRMGMSTPRVPSSPDPASLLGRRAAPPPPWSRAASGQGSPAQSQAERRAPDSAPGPGARAPSPLPARMLGRHSLERPRGSESALAASSVAAPSMAAVALRAAVAAASPAPRQRADSLGGLNTSRVSAEAGRAGGELSRPVGELRDSSRGRSRSRSRAAAASRDSSAERGECSDQGPSVKWLQDHDASEATELDRTDCGDASEAGQARGRYHRSEAQAHLHSRVTRLIQQRQATDKAARCPPARPARARGAAGSAPLPPPRNVDSRGGGQDRLLTARPLDLFY